MNLAQTINRLEDLVLASSGVDAFEEILKLIYAKLYDEKLGYSSSNPPAGGESRSNSSRLRSNNNISRQIEFLFEGAKKQWPGMFKKQDKIEISSMHIGLCVEELWKIALYNTDLAIIDSAFERLLPKSAKGSRGQYFTPRHVIDEVVKILNPRQNESVLDPACGSGGFLLHAFKWIRDDNHHCHSERSRGISNHGAVKGHCLFDPIRGMRSPCPQCLHGRRVRSRVKRGSVGMTNELYSAVPSQLYGVDYDMRMAKIAKGMLLVAGAGNANIFNANSLSYVKELDKSSYDIVLTNPPFGGEIRDEDILSNYTLAKNQQGQVRSSVERHILFIERIIHILKPGGRAGIVVPQGILNNTNLEYVREWIYSKARIVGVIGMDTNTFKPFTNVKTSLLFVQKWKEKVLSDYPIFMAVSEKSGKNLSGEVVYKMRNGNGEMRKGNEVIDSDLPEIAGRLRRFIEEEGLGF